MTGPEFAKAHGDSSTWSAADFEAEMNLAEIDVQPAWLLLQPKPATDIAPDPPDHRKDTVNAAEYRAKAEKTLRPEAGFHKPHDHQVAEADVWAKLAISASISEAADREANATGVTVRPAIRHTV